MEAAGRVSRQVGSRNGNDVWSLDLSREGPVSTSVSSSRCLCIEEWQWCPTVGLLISRDATLYRARQFSSPLADTPSPPLCPFPLLWQTRHRPQTPDPSRSYRTQRTSMSEAIEKRLTLSSPTGDVLAIGADTTL